MFPLLNRCKLSSIEFPFTIQVQVQKRYINRFAQPFLLSQLQTLTYVWVWHGGSRRTMHCRLCIYCCGTGGECVCVCLEQRHRERRLIATACLGCWVIMTLNKIKSVRFVRKTIFCTIFYYGAHLITRRLAVRQARVRFSARHHREVFPTEHTSDEEMERDLGEWRRINVFNEVTEWMYVCFKILKINQKNGILPPNLYKFLILYDGKWEGVGSWNREFFGPCEMASSQ